MKNLKRPYKIIAFAFVSVNPAAGRVLYKDYFSEVVPAIASAIAIYNATAEVEVINKAGFLLIHTYNEQSPGKTGKPSLHGYRMFNVQALPTFDASKKIIGFAPGQEEDGVVIKSLYQGEGPTVETRVLLLNHPLIFDFKHAHESLPRTDIGSCTRQNSEIVGNSAATNHERQRDVAMV